MPRNLSLPLLAVCWLLPVALAQTAPPQSAPPQIAAPQPAPAQTAPPQLPGSEPVDPCAALAAQPGFDTCYADEFKSSDQDMNHMYRAALVVLGKDLDEAHTRSDNDQVTFDTKAIAGLKDAQAAWVKYRDLHCSAAGQQYQGGSIEPTVITRCMILTTRHRTEEIEEAYEIGGRKLE
jgi:uncharacterized protein YecT (DUF1311 family)